MQTLMFFCKYEFGDWLYGLSKAVGIFWCIRRGRWRDKVLGTHLDSETHQSLVLPTKLVTQNGLVAPDIFKHRWQRPEAKAKTICINISNVETIFEEKRLALVGLHTARAYLRLWEMFGAAGRMGLCSCWKIVSRKDLKILKSRSANTVVVALGSVLPGDTVVVQHVVHPSLSQACNRITGGKTTAWLCWSCPDQGNGHAAHAWWMQMIH